MKPAHFPPENRASGWDASHLAGHVEFEDFHFLSCDFGGADLRRLRFADCLFEHCNLAAAQLTDTALQNVAFADCKLLGLQFSTCRSLLFGVHFDRCQLRYASFAGRALPGTRFVGCTLDEADFTDADLTKSRFADCSLAGAVFEHTRLAGADFSTATGFVIDPERNPLRGARFALAGLPGLVARYGLVVE